MVATGGKKDAPAAETAPPWTKEGKRVVNYGTGQTEKKPYTDPAEEFYAPGLYREIRGAMAGLGSPPAISDESRLSMINDAIQRRRKLGPEVLAEKENLERRIRRAQVEQEAVGRLDTALRRGDRDAAAREMALFPRLHKYRDQL